MNSRDMKLIINQVKKLREQKAWSQTHLAEVSDLSLRTIQRIEREQKASPESVKALASVFGVLPEHLLLESDTARTLTKQKSQNSPKLLVSSTMVAAIIAFVIAFVWTSASAQADLTLDISASLKQSVADSQDDFAELADQKAVDEGVLGGWGLERWNQYGFSTRCGCCCLNH